jgi:hypothetical protein
MTLKYHIMYVEKNTNRVDTLQFIGRYIRFYVCGYILLLLLLLLLSQ